MALSSRSVFLGRILHRELISSPSAVRKISSPWPRALADDNRSIVAVARGRHTNADGHALCRRHFSTKQEASKTPEAPPESPNLESADATDTAECEEVDKTAELEKEIKNLKDSLLRSLAEQENTRRIAKRDVQSARSFAISSFAKNLLDSSDNLSRALEAVPENLRHDHENQPVLATLYEGIAMTDEGLTKAFAKNGMTKFGEAGEKFDPNMHEALFEYPDSNGIPGNIGQVLKAGFMLNNRVVRPAEVGVVKAP